MLFGHCMGFRLGILKRTMSSMYATCTTPTPYFEVYLCFLLVSDRGPSKAGYIISIYTLVARTTQFCRTTPPQTPSPQKRTQPGRGTLNFPIFFPKPRGAIACSLVPFHNIGASIPFSVEPTHHPSHIIWTPTLFSFSYPLLKRALLFPISTTYTPNRRTPFFSFGRTRQIPLNSTYIYLYINARETVIRSFIDQR